MKNVSLLGAGYNYTVTHRQRNDNPAGNSCFFPLRIYNECCKRQQNDADYMRINVFHRLLSLLLEFFAFQCDIDHILLTLSINIIIVRRQKISYLKICFLSENGFKREMFPGGSLMLLFPCSCHSVLLCGGSEKFG